MAGDIQNVEPKDAFDIGRVEGFSPREIFFAATRDVLENYVKRAVKAFVEFPNKGEFAQAGLFAAGAVVFAAMARAVSGADTLNFPERVVPLPPAVRTAGMALYTGAFLLSGGASAVLFREWFRRRTGLDPAQR